MDSPRNEIYRNKEVMIDHQSITHEKKIDNQMSQQIESLIQKQYNVFVPALVFEYRPAHNIREFCGWDFEDLSEFFSHFGEIEMLEIYGKLSIVVFKTFLDAYSCKEFLQNTSNFKDSEKDNFIIRWFTQEDEGFSSEIMRNKLKKYTPNQIVDYINSSHTWNNNSNYNNQMNYGNYYNNYNNNPNMGNELFPVSLNSQYNFYSSMSLSPNAKGEFSSVLNSSNIQQSNSYYSGNYQGYEEDVKSASDKCLLNGKYTCKFEIQIENDNEFQVARRLIGAKGCNMKKIVELCSRGKDGKFMNDAVKLRLRGRGSGYKEGPYNKESDEPLHLCISSKFYDKYKRACILVQELIINVYEEYKRYCERTGKIPTSNLTIQKEESVSTRRNAGPNVNSLSKDGITDNY